MPERDILLITLRDNTLLLGAIAETGENYSIRKPLLVMIGQGQNGVPIIRMTPYPIGIEALADFSDDTYEIFVNKEEVRGLTAPTRRGKSEYAKAIKAYYTVSVIDAPTSEQIVKLS